ncbi:MAG: 3-isopropylmalate dehydratase large subunit, partial [uncultured Thermomicrobiales bacterium]
RGGRQGRHDRPRRHHLRLPRGPRPRPIGRRLGTSPGQLALPGHRPRCPLRPRGHPRRHRDPTPRLLGHQSRPGDRHRRRRPRPRRFRRPQGARDRRPRPDLHGPQRRDRDARYPGRYGLHRLLHQRPDRGSPRCRRRPRWPPHQIRDAGDGRAWLDAGQGPSRGRGTGPSVHRRRFRVAGGRVLDVPRHESRPTHPWRALRRHQQSELRGTPGQGRPHPSRLSPGRRRYRHRRPLRHTHRTRL